MTATVAIDIAKLDALFEPYNRADRPGITVGIAHKGVPVYRAGFGLASVELPLALSPGIRMRIGSTSKHFTCLCIMLLAEEGKLSPQDSVRKFMPELKPWADAVTLAGLMSHTSGTRCSLDLIGLAGGVMGSNQPIPHGAQLDLLIRAESVNFPAGTSWVYSNGGYVLLTHVIERVSGMSYEAFLKTRIFDPVGMYDTEARPNDVDCVRNVASLHTPTASGGFTRAVFGPHIGGEGSIISTVNDMLIWLRHMAAPTVGSAATWAEMRTPVPLSGGGSSGYGFGLWMGQYRGVDTVYHTGGVVGGNSQMMKLPAHELDIIVMSNSAGIASSAIANQIIDTCLTGLSDVAGSVPGPFVTGDFHSPATGRYLRLIDKDGGPAIDLAPAQYPLKQHADGSMSFMETFVFQPTDQGIDAIESGAVDHLLRVESPVEQETSSLLGRWRSDEVAMTATVTAGEPVRFSLTSAYGTTDGILEQRSPRLWLVIDPKQGGGATLERDGDDLLFSTPRSRRLRFTRVS